MRSEQAVWSPLTGWTPVKPELAEASFVLYFGARQALADSARYEELRAMFPSAHILGCSTGGQINNNDISDNEIVAAAIKFDATRLRLCQRQIGDPLQSRNCGQALGHALNADDLGWRVRAIRWFECQRQRTCRRNYRSYRPEHPPDRRTCGRRFGVQRNAGGRRLCPAIPHGRRNRVLRNRDSDRPWQRGRMGCVRTAPAGDAIKRKYPV